MPTTFFPNATRT